MIRAIYIAIFILFALGEAAFAQPVDYDIVYVRGPRRGDTTQTSWQEVFNPVSVEPGQDLVLLHPNGSEEVLVAAGTGAVVDPYVSFDGNTVFYSFYPEVVFNVQRGAPYKGADIYKMDLHTRAITRLTFQEWTPNTGVANWASDHLNSAHDPTKNYLGYGIFNLGPCPLPGGKIIFTSSRNGFLPNKGFTFPNLQLFVMDEDGKNVELIGHLNIGSALHPSILSNGEVAFSSYEAQGLRDSRLWSLWSIWPDGRVWKPLMSDFNNAYKASAFHFQAELSNKHVAVVDYYNLNNNGFGTLLAFPTSVPAGVPEFGKADPNDPTNPLVRAGIWWFDPSHPSHRKPYYEKYPFSPFGLYSLSAFSHGGDSAASHAMDGSWGGKVTHPSGAPGNDVLLVWSPGPANDLPRPTSTPQYDGGIYIIRGGVPIDDHHNLVLVKNDPNYNEQQPRAVVPYQRIYGVEKPHQFSWLPNDGSLSAQLPAGTPFGLVGTSTFYKRDTKPGFGDSRYDGLDPFNTDHNNVTSNWGQQGADAGKYSNNDIWAVRVLAMEPSSHRSYGPGGTGVSRGFVNHASERLRILGEIPLRKFNSSGDPIIDVDGNPDTSFLVKVPADTPFTFQTIDRDGLVLNMAQTWHQVRPGEIRNNCGGCHAHSQRPTDFNTTEAAKLSYFIRDLTKSAPLLTKDGSGNPSLKNVSGPVNVEYYRDIKPILERSCVSCHSLNGRQDANLVLEDTPDGSITAWKRLADDQAATYGIKPVINNRTWRISNASRYIRAFQSRRSLLIWKLFGRRLDGWTNADHPTETVPGDRATLPAGADINEADLDYTGTIMPPPGSGVPPLSEDEKIMFARWVDLGAPISSIDPLWNSIGWHVDDLRPTMTVSSPRAGTGKSPLTFFRVGMFDYYTGLSMSTFSAKADFAVNGKAPGTELAGDFSQSGDHIWTLSLSTPITDLPAGTLTISIKDVQGNIVTVKRSFAVKIGKQPKAPTNLRVEMP